eukprot:TRINITY_DN1019_c0_g2_i1.p1 TRINITY_DN1019_c0_g2~~TRINITY_DN1019_c0_g2_i1.p1  ORF type:complete len:601 (+),score=247.38 TRINITY_DN1019_c0_g2_i1:31-1833(+)
MADDEFLGQFGALADAAEDEFAKEQKERKERRARVDSSSAQPVLFPGWSTHPFLLSATAAYLPLTTRLAMLTCSSLSSSSSSSAFSSFTSCAPSSHSSSSVSSISSSASSSSSSLSSSSLSSLSSGPTSSIAYGFNWTIVVDRAVYHYGHGQFDQVIYVCETFASNENDMPIDSRGILRDLYARALIRVERYDEAVRILSKIISQHATHMHNIPCWSKLALCCCKLKWKRPCLHALLLTVPYAPYNPLLWLQFAECVFAFLSSDCDTKKKTNSDNNDTRKAFAQSTMTTATTILEQKHDCNSQNSISSSSSATTCVASCTSLSSSSSSSSSSIAAAYSWASELDLCFSPSQLQSWLPISSPTSRSNSTTCSSSLSSSSSSTSASSSTSSVSSSYSAPSASASSSAAFSSASSSSSALSSSFSSSSSSSSLSSSSLSPSSLPSSTLRSLFRDEEPTNGQLFNIITLCLIRCHELLLGVSRSDSGAFRATASSAGHEHLLKRLQQLVTSVHQLEENAIAAQQKWIVGGVLRPEMMVTSTETTGSVKGRTWLNAFTTDDADLLKYFHPLHVGLVCRFFVKTDDSAQLQETAVADDEANVQNLS